MSLALFTLGAGAAVPPAQGVDIQAVASIFAILLAIGALSTGIAKAVGGLRKFSRLLDGFLGDGTTKHPSVPDRLSGLEERLAAVEDAMTENSRVLVAHVDGDAPQWLADGQKWGNRLDGQVADLDTRVVALEQAKGMDPVVASRK